MALTENQQKALSVLNEKWEILTASQIGVSGQTLSALVRKGFVKKHYDNFDRMAGLPAAYEITRSGRLQLIRG